MATHRLYLRLGDRVMHREHEEWGEGVVTEEMTSIFFEDRPRANAGRRRLR